MKTPLLRGLLRECLYAQIAAEPMAYALARTVDVRWSPVTPPAAAPAQLAWAGPRAVWLQAPPA